MLRGIALTKGRDDMIDFSPLWETMKNKKVSQYRLLQAGIDNKTLDALKKENNITLLTLEKICKILDCTPNDVVGFTEDDGRRKKIGFP